MPGPTNTELIRELTKDVATLKEQVQALRGQTASLGEITTKIAVLEHQVSDLKKGKETLAARAWMVLAPLLAGVVGALLTHYLKR